MGANNKDHGHDKLMVRHTAHREYLQRELQKYRESTKLKCSTPVRKGVVAALSLLLSSDNGWEYHATLQMRMTLAMDARPRRDHVDQVMTIMRELTSSPAAQAAVKADKQRR